MSVINKKPLIEKVVSALSPEQKKNLLKGLNGELTKSVKVFDNLSTSDKGISYVDIKFADGVKTGYLVYNDAVSVLIAYYSDTQKMTLFILDVPKHTYKASREYLTIDELRRIVGLELVEIGENIKVQVGDIDSGSQTSNKIIVSDGEGGASWGSVIDVIENADVQDGSAQYLIGIDSNGDVVKDEIPEGIVVDQTIVEDSTNAVSGGAVYDALELKANSSDVYTKAAADELLDGKSSITALENGTIVPAKSLVAEQLENVSEDSGTTQDAPFVFQATATDGGAGASDTAPIAKYLKLKGNSIAWNQGQKISTKASFTDSDTGLTITNNNDGSITISGTIIASKDDIEITDSSDFSAISGHKYITKIVNGSSYLKFRYEEQSNSNFNYGENGKSWKATNTRNSALYMSVDSSGIGQTINITIYPQTFDLAQMYGGNDNIPTAILNGVTLSDYGLSFSGVDIFNQLFPLPYYAYNEGTLVSANATLLTTLGKNQFDYSHPTDFIQVVNSQKYIVKNANGGTLTEYDGAKNEIGTTSINSADKVVTLSSNTHYVKISGYGATTCFFLAWLENGTTSRPGFEEFVKHEYQLGDELKDNPLLSAGSVCDEKTPDGTITRRIGVVDLGTLDWIYQSGNQRFNATSVISDMKIPNNDTVPNFLNNGGYQSIDFNNLFGDMKISIYSGVSLIYIRDYRYTSASDLKTALSGVYLYYELATPTTTQGTPFPAIAEVDDMGTMGYGGTNFNGYPQGCEFFYPADYVLFIDSLGNTCDFDASKFALKENLSTAFASFMQSISGYDASKTQTLKHIEGTLTWVDDE